jgi:hypothetical protein
VTPGRVRAQADVTEAQLLIAEADRLDRANDALGQEAARRTPGASDVDNGPAEMAEQLEERANDYDYDRDAVPGGTADAATTSCASSSPTHTRLRRPILVRQRRARPVRLPTTVRTAGSR